MLMKVTCDTAVVMNIEVEVTIVMEDSIEHHSASQLTDSEVLGDGCTGHCAVSIDDNGTLLTEVHCLLTCHIADIHWYHSF